MRQKNLMSDFMLQHQDLAKNILPNCGQGKVAANKLWEALTLKLNAAGPPMKDAKSWRKVFADQKHNIKKKISFNKASKQRTGGGPYEEKLLTAAEEQLLQATGIDVAVEGLTVVKSFGNVEPEEGLNELVEMILDSEEEDPTPSTSRSATKSCKAKPTVESEKLSLLKCNLRAYEVTQAQINNNIEKLLALKQRSLQIKEEAHAADMKIKAIELEIKTHELDILKRKIHK
ncbi:uncharacterized protein LOC125775513 [Bactrocera dorsalis]|uniref:Uncharacterized protein LOC125775513 n=1 Tax=Bactrocera dorsalis TaxID=27457 RepID=A0ABM3IYR3_BACDO|nr:uncharacterized protein LOC125775513 [Bactrocera dorsalis]